MHGSIDEPFLRGRWHAEAKIGGRRPISRPGVACSPTPSWPIFADSLTWWHGGLTHIELGWDAESPSIPLMAPGAIRWPAFLCPHQPLRQPDGFRAFVNRCHCGGPLACCSTGFQAIPQGQHGWPSLMAAISL